MRSIRLVVTCLMVTVAASMLTGCVGDQYEGPAVGTRTGYARPASQDANGSNRYLDRLFGGYSPAASSLPSGTITASYGSVPGAATVTDAELSDLDNLGEDPFDRALDSASLDDDAFVSDSAFEYDSTMDVASYDDPMLDVADFEDPTFDATMIDDPELALDSDPLDDLGW